MQDFDLIMTPNMIDAFLDDLISKERARNTILKYRHDLTGFSDWMAGRPVTRELLLEYKHMLQNLGRAPSSINSILSALNCFTLWAGRGDLRIGFLKIQRRVFRDASQDLTRSDYTKLVDTAYTLGKNRLGLLLETLGATGIRISELKYLTVEAARDGRAEIDLKGKIRTILIPGKLQTKLLDYAKRQNISSGQLFLTSGGQPLSRQSIWRDMKHLAVKAGIPESKVYPHNFRHMFATVFYHSCKDIVKLADVLGHSSVDTTRIYLISSEREHARQLDRLGLVR